MRRSITRRIMIALVVLLAFGISLDEASAQQRRTRRSRRVTNPVASQPVVPPTTSSSQSAEPQIISTADQQGSEQGNALEVNGQVPARSRPVSRKRPAAEPETEEDSMRRTVNDLSNQVNRLSDKLSQMEENQRTLVDMERLSRAEQRAEALRTQQRDVLEKEGILQARLEQIEFNLKPENIERSVSTYGSTRPEEARDARRRGLESEKVRVQAQIELYATSRQRLETAIINADLEVDKLRRRIEEATEPPAKLGTPADINADDTEDTSTTRPTTVPPTSTNPPL